MPAVNPGEIWMTDFGMAAKVRPALILTAQPDDDELDLVTMLLHATALRGNRWEFEMRHLRRQRPRRDFGKNNP